LVVHVTKVIFITLIYSTAATKPTLKFRGLDESHLDAIIQRSII